MAPCDPVMGPEAHRERDDLLRRQTGLVGDTLGPCLLETTTQVTDASGSTPDGQAFGYLTREYEPHFQQDRERYRSASDAISGEEHCRYRRQQADPPQQRSRKMRRLPDHVLEPDGRFDRACNRREEFHHREQGRKDAMGVSATLRLYWEALPRWDHVRTRLSTRARP